MKKLIVPLCVFAAFIFIEARPWYEGNSGDNGYSSSGYSSDSNANGGNGTSGYEGIGYESNGYGSNGYGNSGNNGNARQNEGPSHFDYEAFVAKLCPDCKAKVYFGNGHYNTITFDLPRGIYD